MQDIEVNISTTPFPHAIFRNFYNDRELDLIWEELNFYTRPNKLLDVKEYMGVVGSTNARAIILDDVYENHRSISNILTCLLYTSPSPRDRTRSRMPSSA